jgi:quinol-cytochrome oxidoreductase complex cytochrome b subunit
VVGKGNDVSAASTRADEYDRTVQASPFDKVAYLFALVGLYVMVGSLFFYGFWSKAVDGDFKIPPPLEEQFNKTIIGTIPGADASWVIITIIEGLVFLLLVASLVTMEFRPSRRKPFLLTSLALALLVFGLMSFGQNATEQHESAASLYGYFGATVILMLFVRTLPPYTSNRWLA